MVFACLLLVSNVQRWIRNVQKCSSLNQLWPEMSKLNSAASALNIVENAKISESALRMTNYLWELNPGTLKKTSQQYWKCLRHALNIYENLWSSLKMFKHNWTIKRISSSLWKRLNITEKLWKLLFQLWNCLRTSVGSLYCKMVFDLCFVDFLWTTLKKNRKRKENKLTIRTKLNTL